MSAASYLRRPEVRLHPSLIGRRLWFALLQRVAPGQLDRPVPIRTPIGQVWSPRSDLVGRGYYLYGAQEPVAAAAFRRLVHPGDVVVDVGAHVGYYSLLSSIFAGPHGRILAIEPDPRNHELLLRTLSGIEHLDAVQCAVSDQQGRGRFRLAARDNTGQSTLCEGGDVEVDVRTLDEIVEVYGVRHLDVLKIDVEGNEEAVLAGGRRSIERWRPRIMFEAPPRSEGAVRSVQFLRSLGYDIFGPEPVADDVRLVAIGDSMERWTLPYEEVNLFALHRGQA